MGNAINPSYSQFPSVFSTYRCRSTNKHKHKEQNDQTNKQNQLTNKQTEQSEQQTNRTKKQTNITKYAERKNKRTRLLAIDGCSRILFADHAPKPLESNGLSALPKQTTNKQTNKKRNWFSFFVGLSLLVHALFAHFSISRFPNPDRTFYGLYFVVQLNGSEVVPMR